MKRFLFSALVILTLLSVFSFSALAYNEKAEDTYFQEEKEVKEENFFELLYGEFIKHSDKLLSALAFFGSLLVACAYRKGLLPIIKASLGTLNTAVSSLKDESERVGAEASATMLEASKRLDAAQEVVCVLSERLVGIERQLDLVNEKQLSGESIHAVMSAQIDMLYEIFMSSSLPAYQKESVGERIAEMKRSLAVYSDRTVNSANE